MHHGELNINAIARCLAECEAFGRTSIAWPSWAAMAWSPTRSAVVPRPNQLIVRVVRARRLRKPAIYEFEDPGGLPDDCSNAPRQARSERFEGACSVEVRARSARARTQTASATCGGAMWNETFALQLTDPSTVVRLSVVRDEHGTGSSNVPLGAFVMTAKWLVAAPLHCDHEHGQLEVDGNGFRGWIRLRDGKLRRHPDEDVDAPELDVSVRWIHVRATRPSSKEEQKMRLSQVPGAFDAAHETATPGTALEQLTTNSEESMLRVGDVKACRRMLQDFPLTIDVKRVSIRHVWSVS